MLSYSPLDLWKESFTEQYLRLYMCSYLSIQASCRVKMRSVQNDIEFYCCGKCVDQSALSVTFQNDGDNYRLKEYRAGNPKCVWANEKRDVNYYTNLIQLHYPVVKQFVVDFKLQKWSANKILKECIKQKLFSPKTFLDLLDNMDHQDRLKIRKKWSNLITKFRREAKVRLSDDNDSQDQRSTESRPQTKIKTSMGTHATFRPIKVSVIAPQSLKQNRPEQPVETIYFSDADKSDVSEKEINVTEKEAEFNLNEFADSWEKPQEPLRLKTLNIDQSLPKFLHKKTSSIQMPEPQNPSFQSVGFYTCKWGN